MKNKSDRIMRKVILDQLRESERVYVEEDGPMHAQITTPSGEIAYVNWLNVKQPCPQLDNQMNRLPADCYGATLSFEEVVEDLRKERQYQADKYGEQPQSLPGFLLILQKEINEAVDGWMRGVGEGRDSPLHEVRQIAATAVACLERYGSTGITINANDTPVPYVSE